MVVANETPLSIGRVTLRVHDLAGVGDFYQRAIGLHRHAGEGDTLSLGNGRDVLLDLISDTAARRASHREAGLFHTAFLLPERADLGRFLTHFAALGLRLDGAADHIVSEAVYLRDPEGNGIEVYRDRPSDQWSWQSGEVVMRNDPLDFEGILASGADAAWTGAPDGTVVGHVHLQVGEIAPAEAFYTSALGLDVTCRYPGATFFSSGGYHHHIATNIWNSRGAPPRALPATGLVEVELKRKAGQPEAGEALFADPWGTTLSVRG